MKLSLRSNDRHSNLSKLDRISRRYYALENHQDPSKIHQINYGFAGNCLNIIIRLDLIVFLIIIPYFSLKRSIF